MILHESRNRRKKAYLRHNFVIAINCNQVRIVILYNPIAGAGLATEAAKGLCQTLSSAGHESQLAQTCIKPSSDWLDDELKDTGALVVVGGDGAVRLAAEPALRNRTPIYHFPYGTENLFSRNFAMDKEHETLLKAVDRNQPRMIDMGIANGHTFLLMASIGYDANVVHDLSQHRGSSISHMTYLMPMARQLLVWNPPRISVKVDGEEIQIGDPAMIIVANSSQYAARLNPAPNADISDGQLDVVIFPIKNKLQLVAWLVKCRRGSHLKDGRLILCKGKHIEISCQKPEFYQLDGDPPPVADNSENATTQHLDIKVLEAVLPVLVP